MLTGVYGHRVARRVIRLGFTSTFPGGALDPAVFILSAIVNCLERAEDRHVYDCDTRFNPLLLGR